MQPRMLERYKGEIVGKLSEEFGFKNVHQVPRLTKIVVNVGLGEATQNPQLLVPAAEELGLTQAVVLQRERILHDPGLFVLEDAGLDRQIGALTQLQRAVFDGRERCAGGHG